MKRIIILISIIILALIFCISCMEQAETSVHTDSEVSMGTNDADAVYTVIYNDAPNGKIVGETKQFVRRGESASEVKAVADKGYVFVMWSDGVKNATRRDSFITQNITVSPVFATEDTKDLLDIGIPVINIYTESKQEITSKETYIKCSVSVSGTLEEYCFEGASAQIRGRGNTSWSYYPKKSYRIKFDFKRSMMGSDYKAKDWTLISNYGDKSLSRNAIAHELAKRFDSIAFASMNQFVEVYLNGEYNGLYLLCDQIETGRGRVEVSEKWAADGDTGYLIEMDKRATQEDVDYFEMENDVGHYYRLKTPDSSDENYDPSIYLAYIKNYMENAMYAINDIKEWEEICSYIDVDSFAEAYIIFEIMANLDCHSFSFYMYKEQGGKLYCGPVWDFDISSGNNNYGYDQEDGTIVDAVPDLDLQVYGELWAAKQNRWFRRLLRIPEFETLVAQKLEKYEDTINDVISLLETDGSNKNSYYSVYGEAIDRNFERWDIMGEYIWPNTQTLVDITTAKGQIDYLHEWLTQRHKIVRNRFGLQ